MNTGHLFVVSAKPEVASQTAGHFDGGTIPWLRLIFDLRHIPGLLREHIPDEADRRIGIDQVTESWMV